MSKIPSIAMIPSAYKSGKVYSVLPSDGSGDLNFARTSEATRVNQNGLIEKVGSNVPRIDYTDGGCPKLLLEPQSTNLITYSEDFSDASWTKGNAPTLNYNVGISPSGDVSTTTIEDTNGSNFKTLKFSKSTAINKTYTFSLFVKKESTKTNYGGIAINFIGGTTKVSRLIFDETNGDFFITSDTTASNVIGKSEDFGSFYKFSITATDNGSNTQIDALIYATISNDGTTTTTGIGSAREIWGAQLEEQSYATSYIPTNGFTVTREAETASKSGLSSYINSQEGVLYAEISALADDLTSRSLSLSDGSYENSLILQYRNQTNTLTVKKFTTIIGNVQLPNSLDNVKVCISYRSNLLELYLNGVKVLVDNTFTSFSSNTLNKLAFNRGDGSEPFYGKTKALKVYNQALTDLELEELTSWKSFSEMARDLLYTIQ